MKTRQRMCPSASGLQARWFGIAVLVSGQSIAQQVPESQMPQAPRAPTIESVRAGTQAADNGSGFSAPELGGKVELNLQQAEGQDNDSELRRDTGEAEVQLTLEFEQSLSHNQELVAQLELNSRYFTEDVLNVEDEDLSYQLERLYFQWNPSPSFRIRAGRFSLDDPMETIIDEDLDGIQVSFETDRLEIELSRTQKDWVEASTRGRVDKITNTMGLVQLSPNRKSRWMPYVLHRSTEQFNDISAAEVTWLGLQGIVQPDRSALRYWLHGSVQDGEETDADGKTSLGGYLVDIGINWTASGRLEPTFTVGVAQATGGSRADRFRQSGLHSNDFALNGKNSFRYLGEVMDPELTNIQIVTLGVGADLSKNWSADIALHHYKQVETDDALRGSDVEFDPLGENSDLGFGADLILGYDPDNQFEFTGTAGVFDPGEAFDDNQAMAWLARFELGYNF